VDRPVLGEIHIASVSFICAFSMSVVPPDPLFVTSVLSVRTGGPVVNILWVKATFTADALELCNSGSRNDVEDTFASLMVITILSVEATLESRAEAENMPLLSPLLLQTSSDLASLPAFTGA